MSESQPHPSQPMFKSLVDKSIEQQDPSGWFEPLYAAASGNTEQVPWAKNRAHPYLQEWLQIKSPQTQEKLALVVGCGLGDDAELLASLGYEVTAFDISPTAIAWCQKRFSQSRVNYLVADLFSLDTHWQHKFDFVFECRTVQALPLSVRTQVIETIADLVAIQGTLLVITRHREDNTIPSGPPWALSDLELEQFITAGLIKVKDDIFLEGEQLQIEQHRLEYRRH
ncbi:MAG: class I SAM-dependent methyltransferase [Cyanobacteria bacterium J06623_7]